MRDTMPTSGSRARTSGTSGSTSGSANPSGSRQPPR
jgi:hypothetical protein